MYIMIVRHDVETKTKNPPPNVRGADFLSITQNVLRRVIKMFAYQISLLSFIWKYRKQNLMYVNEVVEVQFLLETERKFHFEPSDEYEIEEY